jgi:hypothetical protein
MGLCSQADVVALVVVIAFELLDKKDYIFRSSVCYFLIVIAPSLCFKVGSP